MPIQQTYYLNGSSLSLATAVFMDSGFTTCAPDGYYFDGSVARQQVGCSLLPAEACPTCGTSCQGVIPEAISYNGTYFIPFFAGDTITDTGAIIITIFLDNTVNGIKVTFDGNIYNQLSSPVHGYLAGTPTGFTYIGDAAADCGIDGSTIPLSEYIYDGTNYVATGITVNEYPTTGEIQFTATDPDVCVMVIPKPNTTPSNLSINIVGPCPGSNAYVSVSCPIKLPSFLGTLGVTSVTPEFFCNFPYDLTYYIAPVNGDGITLGQYDWVFSDINGANVLPDGFYRGLAVPAPFDTFEIVNGVVVDFHSYCAA